MLCLGCDVPPRRFSILTKAAETHTKSVWRIGGAQDEQELMGLYKPLTEEDLAWAVRKDDGELLRGIEKAFDEIKSSGALGTALNRWIPLQVEVQ